MTDEKKLEISPIQHIRNLLKSIKDGKLIITYDDSFWMKFDRTYTVSCTEAETDECILKYETLTRALEAIGKVHEKLDNGAKVEEMLTPDQVTVWNTYVRDFEESFDAGEYDLLELYMRRDDGDQLSDDEYEVLEQRYEWLEKQCLKRLPKKAYSPMLLINRAQRYEYVVMHNEPKIIVDKEGCRLAEEMILYYYGV